MPGNTYYVSKAGSNLNNGLSWATAKQTLQAAVNLCPLTNSTASGNWSSDTVYDTIKIRPGVYGEQVDVARRHLKLVGVDFMEDGGGKGRVIVDGEDLRPHCLNIGVSMVHTHTQLEGLELRRAQTSLFGNSLGGNWNLECYDCELHSAPEGLYNLSVRLYRSLIRDMRTSTANGVFGQFVVTRGEYGTQWYYDCTFANGPAAKPMLFFDRVYPKIYRCIFVKCPIMVHWRDATVGVDVDYNGYDFTSGKMLWSTSSTDVLSLAAFQAFFPATHDVHSLELDPAVDIADAAKGLWSPTLAGSLSTASELGEKIGALFPGFGMSINRNPTFWSDGTLTNLEQRSNGNFVIVDGEQVGLYTTPVVDLGDHYRLYGLRIADVLERYPTDVVDADIDDEPNRHNFEYRFSRISEVHCTAQEWRTVERCSAGRICFSTAIHARWVQIRITLRTDGTEIGS